MQHPEINYPFNLELRSESAENLAVLSGFEFLNDFQLEARKARERVWAQAMAVYPNHPGQLFLRTLEEQAQRGLDVRLNVDCYSNLVSESGINALIPLKSAFGKGKFHKEQNTYNKEYLRKIKDNGVFITFLNPPTLREKIFPFTGRNHIKLYIVDNVAYLGGINIEKGSFNSIDFVIKLTDKDVVRQLALQFQYGNSIKEDFAVDFPNGDTLMVDSGNKGQSLILDTAVDMVSMARSSVYNISFFTPDGPFAKEMYSAHTKGIDVEVVTPFEAPGGVFGILDTKNLLAMRVGRRSIPFVFVPDAIHAKLLIIDDEKVLFGSHNLMESGVKAGTREIAYISQNPKLVTNLARFYEHARTS